MKYNQFFAELTAAGCYVLRHGANHDIWYSPKTGNKFALSRHGKQEVPTGILRFMVERLFLLRQWGTVIVPYSYFKRNGYESNCYHGKSERWVLLMLC